jgi:hypothetical protein
MHTVDAKQLASEVRKGIKCNEAVTVTMKSRRFESSRNAAA